MPFPTMALTGFSFGAGDQHKDALLRLSPRIRRRSKPGTHTAEHENGGWSVGDARWGASGLPCEVLQVVESTVMKDRMLDSLLVVLWQQSSPFNDRQ